MIRPRNLITIDEINAVNNFMYARAQLSGYLAGNPRGGAAVQRLEEVWATKFGRRHAIAVNSATSGLLAAVEAVGYGVDGSHVPIAVPALSMSATAAVPQYLNNAVAFLDVDRHGCACFDDFSKNFDPCAVILTTLFGHPLDRRWSEWRGGPKIIDNAQGILSGWPDMSTERMGDIVVSSLNVHKQLNAGEGGIITTDDDFMASEMRHFINHAENGTGFKGHMEAVGLNLRMTELSAVLALSQLARIDETIANLHRLCCQLDGVMPPAFTPLPVADGAQHGRYCYAFTVPAGTSLPGNRRDIIVDYLTANGVPAIPMMRPLYELPAFAHARRHCPQAEALAASGIVFELTLWRYEDDISAVERVLGEAAKL